jgi:hypothetical protein
MTASGTDAAGTEPENAAAAIARQLHGISKPRVRRLADLDDGDFPILVLPCCCALAQCIKVNWISAVVYCLSHIMTAGGT